MPTDADKAAQAHVKLAKSAVKLQVSAEQQTDSADRRTELAADCTVLATERTYAAWVRTGLAALAAGIGARPLLKDVVPDWLIVAATGVLIGFAVFCFIAGVWRQLDRSVPPPRSRLRVMPGIVLIVFNGFLVALGIAALIGLWLR